MPTTLTTLCLSGNAFVDMEELSHQLSGLRSLRSLDLSNCQLRRLPRLPKLPLQRLDVSANFLSSSTGVARCSALRCVTLAKNRLVKTDELEMLLDLRVLDLSENCLRSEQLLRPLAACARLESLQIHRNPFAQAKHRAWAASMFPSLIWLDEHVLRPQRLRKKGQPEVDAGDNRDSPSGGPERPDDRGPRTKDSSFEYAEYAFRYARPTISSKMAQTAQTVAQTKEPSETESKPLQRSSKPTSGPTFAPVARSRRSCSQPSLGCRGHPGPFRRPRPSAEKQHPRLRDNPEPRANANLDVMAVAKDTHSAALSASVSMQTRHSALCRELIEDGERACGQ